MTFSKVIVVALIGTLTVALSGCTDAPGAEAGQVVRIIDGDTLVINFDSVDQTVRLLNVDTPETKHPDKPVECLGLEATVFLEDLLPPGTQVGLDFDIERQDQYDRTLAAVFTQDGTLVNAEIARQGLGVPVLFEPNEKYYSAVQDAHAEAQAQQLGFFDAGTECTVPAEVERTMQALTEAMEASTGSTAAAVGAAAAALAAALAAAETLDAAFDAEKTAARWIAITGSSSTVLAGDLANTIGSGKSRLTVLESKANRLGRAEEKATAAKEAEAEHKAAEVKAEKARQAAEAKAEAERKAIEAAAAAERERIRNLPPPAPYVPPAPAPYVPPYVPPAPAPYVPPAPPYVAPAPANPYPGYNGPRCYAPGGQSWKPCP